MLTVPKIKKTVAKIGKAYGIKSAYLFGSYAKNTATEHSDVDLIIDKGAVHTFKDFFHLYKDLKNELGTEIDILTTKGVTPEFDSATKDDRILLYAA